MNRKTSLNMKSKDYAKMFGVNSYHINSLIIRYYNMRL